MGYKRERNVIKCFGETYDIGTVKGAIDLLNDINPENWHGPFMARDENKLKERVITFIKDEEPVESGKIPSLDVKWDGAGTYGIWGLSHVDSPKVVPVRDIAKKESDACF